MSNWINYAEQRPETAGAYRWRLPSLAIPGLFITFTAHHRSRMAGFETVNSPVFDHWDGYNVHVPQGTQWQVLEESKDCERFRIIDVAVEGLAPRPCPYCNKVPVVDGITRYAGGGVSTSNPDRFNAWTLKCCSWGSTPTYADPRELVDRREKALSKQGQHQGEPVAYRHIELDGEKGMWFDAHPESLEHALKDVERGIYSQVELAYGAADAGEVERWKGRHEAVKLQRNQYMSERDTLRADLETMRRKNEEYCDDLMKARDQLDVADKAISHAAQQAEAKQKVSDALMADAKHFREKANKLEAQLKRQPEFIHALEQFEAEDGTFVRLSDVLGALSASKEPSLVECDTCPRSSGCMGTCMKAPASEAAGVQS